MIDNLPDVTLFHAQDEGRGYMAEAFPGRGANRVVHRSAIPVLAAPGHP